VLSRHMLTSAHSQDASEAINFLSACGKDELFATGGISSIGISEILSGDRSCCSIPNRETEEHSCQMSQDCHICKSVGDYSSTLTPPPHINEYPSMLATASHLDKACTSTASERPTFDRPACSHQQLDRIFAFLAARVPGRRGFEEQNLTETITRMRRHIETAWRNAQIRSGWTFEGGELDFPPGERCKALSIPFDGEKKISFQMFLMKHGEGSRM